MIRNAFITGVSSGIGFALAKAFLEQGTRVYGVSRRSPDELATLPEFIFRSADLADLAHLPSALKNFLGGVNQLDVVVLNAGILGPIADLADTPLEEMQRVVQVNLWANKVILDTLFHSRMPITQVVAISSGAATSVNRGWNAYAISKAALNTMVALYAAENLSTHFCALAPGIVDTAMQDQISEMPPDPRFGSLEMLRAAKGSPMMPTPAQAAPRIIEAIAKATKYPSGSFLDLNTIVKRSWST